MRTCTEISVIWRHIAKFGEKKLPKTLPPWCYVTDSVRCSTEARVKGSYLGLTEKLIYNTYSHIKTAFFTLHCLTTSILPRTIPRSSETLYYDILLVDISNNCPEHRANLPAFINFNICCF